MISYSEFCERYPDAPDGAYAAMLEHERDQKYENIMTHIVALLMLAGIVFSVVATWPHFWK